MVREAVDDMVGTLVSSSAVSSVGSLGLLDALLPTYDVALTEHLVVDADTMTVFDAAKNFDFVTTRSFVVTAMMTARSAPSRMLGRPVATPPSLMLARDSGALPGWVVLGEVPGRELVFGAVGKFWNADIEWHDLAADEFAGFAEPGWGKIACRIAHRGPAPTLPGQQASSSASQVTCGHVVKVDPVAPGSHDAQGGGVRTGSPAEQLGLVHCRRGGLRGAGTCRCRR